MPQLHLTKVAFGCRTIEALEKRVAARARGGEVRVVTRMRPKRADELVGGSIYWIVKHRLVACQQILRFEDRTDGRIDIVCSGELILIAAQPQASAPGLALSRGGERALRRQRRIGRRGPPAAAVRQARHARPGLNLAVDTQPLAGRSVEQVLLFLVRFDVGGEERADRNHLQSAFPRRGQGPPGRGRCRCPYLGAAPALRYG